MTEEGFIMYRSNVMACRDCGQGVDKTGKRILPKGLPFEQKCKSCQQSGLSIMKSAAPASHVDGTAFLWKT
jgi:DnaJ-class molecular chaperone